MSWPVVAVGSLVCRDGSSSQVTAVEAVAPAGSIAAHLESPEATAAVVHNFEVRGCLPACLAGWLHVEQA